MPATDLVRTVRQKRVLRQIGRMEKGMETLVKHADEGFNTMPPKGLCFDCSADEFKALIEYMATPKS
jgi:cytochrome c5